MATRSIRLNRIAEQLNVPLYGRDIEIEGLGLCNRETVYSSVLSYITSENYLQNALDNPGIKALISSPACYDRISGEDKSRFSWLISGKPEEDFYKAHAWLGSGTDFYEKPNFAPVIGTDCEIHPSAVLENGVTIGDHVTIGAHSVVRCNTRIGDHTHVGCCSVIGSPGFQIIRTAEGTPFNVWHAGGTRIGNHVWIGDNVTVGNALFEGEVVVDDHALIDNHTHVAHNCTVGRNSVLTSGVVLLGSAVIRDNCWLAPGSMVMNRVVVEDHAVIGINSVADKRVKAGVTVIGTPAVPIEEFTRFKYKLKKLTK